MYFAGQDVPLSATVLDDSGNPATESMTVTVTVTDPLGNATTPATVSAGAGVYTAIASSATTLGVWLVAWSAVGTNVRWTYADQFTVRPVGVEQIVDLVSVKKHLNINLADTRSDDELQNFILTAADQARDVVGPLLPEVHTEWFDGGASWIFPDWVPLASILSCTEYYGLSAFLLTEQQLGAQMNAFAFTADYTTGQITRRTFGGEAALFAAGSKNIKLTYTAGRAGVIPYTVRLGALELIRHLWQQTQQSGRPRFGSSAQDGDVAGAPMGFALPDRVIELWSPFRRPPGIA